MQTFLPYSDFKKSVKCLDNKRLGKQRVEAFQIHNIVSGKRTTGGWISHPAVLMWKGYPDALALYYNECILEWIARGFKNNMVIIKIENENDVEMPPWLGDEKLHSSHRSNLLNKDFEYYSVFGWKDNQWMPYYWPVR